MKIQGRAYINSAHSLSLPIEVSDDYSPNDVDEITVNFTLRSDSSTVIAFKKSLAEVQIIEAELLKIFIKDNKVTVPGSYDLSIKWTDKTGQNHTGTFIKGGTIRFYSS